jgi:hypothetical protein
MALIVLWLRSYHYSDDISARLGPYHGINVRSWPGLINLEQFDLSSPSVWPLTFTTVHYQRGQDDIFKLARMNTKFGFAALLDWHRQKVTLPYWFPVLSIGILAIGLRARWPATRFRLRTAFAAMTIIAMTLATISWLNRAGFAN